MNALTKEVLLKKVVEQKPKHKGEVYEELEVMRVEVPTKQIFDDFVKEVEYERSIR